MMPAVSFPHLSVVVVTDRPSSLHDSRQFLRHPYHLPRSQLSRLPTIGADMGELPKRQRLELGRSCLPYRARISELHVRRDRRRTAFGRRVQERVGGSSACSTQYIEHWIRDQFRFHDHHGILHGRYTRSRFDSNGVGPHLISIPLANSTQRPNL